MRYPILSIFVIISLIASASAENYIVIANASNPIAIKSNDAKFRIKQLYLKESKNWKTSLVAKPFARSLDSPTQIAFEQSVLGMSRKEINAHWLRLKQIRGETPPRSIGSTTILLRQVERKPGAFAVVRQSEYVQSENTIILYKFYAE